MKLYIRRDVPSAGNLTFFQKYIYSVNISLLLDLVCKVLAAWTQMEQTHGPNFWKTHRHSYRGGNHRLLSSPSPQRIERYYGKSDCFPKPQPWRKYVRQGVGGGVGKEAEVATAPYFFSFSSTLFHPDFRWARKGSLSSRHELSKADVNTP